MNATLCKLSCLVSLGLLTACPSEPTQASDKGMSGVYPGAGAPMISESSAPKTSLVDEVEVTSPEEALQQANQEIDDSNVLDELKALEDEIEGN